MCYNAIESPNGIIIMKTLLRYFMGLSFAAALSASGQNLGNYLWTNVVAFPGLPSFNAPVCIASPPGETNRLFICEHVGNIIVVTNLAAPTRTVFMNLTGRVTLSGEAGLCGLAFHPGYASNGLFYVFYSGQTNSGLCEFVSRFQVSTTNANQGDTNSEVRLFGQPDREDNHNGGDLHFGSDGYLYISVGDEGAQYNGHNNAQHINSNFFSGILRIDVDKLPGSLPPNPDPNAFITSNYAIPADNPFVGATSFDGISINPAQVRTEFWAVGMRNPWRFNFDPLNGVLYCGDVGQDTVEEINIVTKGGNYGWATYEGHLNPPPGVSAANVQPTAQNPIFPILQYNHGSGATNGNCVIGGVVYRGTRFPQLYGAYIYGEYSNSRIWGSFYDGTNATKPVLLSSGSASTAFGIDPRNGDVIYTVDGTGTLKRIIGLTPAITSLQYNTTNAVLFGAGGPPTSPYVLQSSTNLMNWISVVTGQIDGLGNFTTTNALPGGAAETFYRIKR
jgi:glucose/arabinose dehydrogenase